MRRDWVGLLGASGLAMIAAQPAFAQADNEDEANAPIVVTAQRRAEASVDVPITVQTLGVDALETSNVQALSDIAKITPSLRFDNAGAYFQPTIRGVGTPVTSAGSQGNVGIYVDGYYSPNPLVTNFDLLNVESIQVLKGPQGTLFGRNTTGGAILVQTADPSTETSGQARFSFGRFNEVTARGYATFGISDTVAIDVAGKYRRGDGWLTNISNNKKVGDFENWSVRLGLWAELSDNVEVLVHYEHGEVDDPTPLLTASFQEPGIGTGYPYYAQPGEYTFDPDEVASGTLPNDQEFFRSNSDNVQVTVRADLGFADLTSYSQYRREIADASLELDYSGVEYFQIGLPNRNKTWTQELLLTSKPGTPLQWTAGLFYFENTDVYPVYFDLYAPLPFLNNRSIGFGSSATAKSYAAYLDMTYEVTPKLFVTAGARYAYDKVTDAFGQCLFCPVVTPTKAQYDAVNGSRVTPRFVVRYKPTDETSVYASYTKGYKAAILDYGTGQTLPVKPETIDAFEAGFKLDNRKLSLETSAFYYDYKNLQVSVYLSGQAVILNAANSEIYGLDAQLRYKVSPEFELTAGGAWVHARYKRFENAPVFTRCDPTIYDPLDFTTWSCGFANTDTFYIPTGITLTNVHMPRSPEFTGFVGARYNTDLGNGSQLTLSGKLSYSSSFYFGSSGIQGKQKGYEVLSLRAQWTDPSDRYSVALWGENVTDSRYKTQVQFALSGIGANWSKPVTMGLEVGMKFGP